MISPSLQVGVLKGARHANAAHLMAVFLVTPEAQEIWERYTGQSSALVSGTPAHKYFQGKKVVYMSQQQAADFRFHKFLLLLKRQLLGYAERPEGVNPGLKSYFAF